MISVLLIAKFSTYMYRWLRIELYCIVSSFKYYTFDKPQQLRKGSFIYDVHKKIGIWDSSSVHMRPHELDPFLLEDVHMPST